MNTMKEKNKGITLIALIITIIVLFIIAGITIGSLTTNNSIIKQATNAKNSTKVSEEKEIVKMSAVMSMKKTGDVVKEDLKNILAKDYSQNPTKVYKSDKDLYVLFEETKNYYKVDKEGDIEGPIEIEGAKDAKPGNYKTDAEGRTVAGTSTDPYQINSIEDLCELSNASFNNSFSGKYFKVMVDLDFESFTSYVNGKIETTIEPDEEGNPRGIPSCNDMQELQDILTDRSGIGFIPIGTKSDFWANFNGNNKEIKNIYINTEKGGNAALIANIRVQSQRIENVIISGEMRGKSFSAGIIGSVGYNGTIYVDNCINKCNVTSINGNAGGIIGYATHNYVYISNCSNIGNITGIGAASGSYGPGGVAGIVGSSYGASFYITNCFNTGDIKGNTYTGGIIGHGYNGNKITNCYNLGSITATAKSAGGIMGEPYAWAGESNITNCYNRAKITGLANKYKGITCWEDHDNVKIKNSYICNVNNGDTSVLNTKAEECTEEELKSNTIVNIFNNYIESNEDEIDMTGCCRWVYNEGNYPTLDYSTTWNGTEWITNN